MKKIQLFAMNSKGYAVARAIAERFGPQAFEFIVSERDPSLENDFYQEIESLCREQAIPFYPRKQAPDVPQTVALAVGWRWMLPTGGELYVLHDSLLPRYRGFAPLVSALINGEPAIGVTLLVASDNYDEGPVVGQKQTAITYPVRMRELLPRIEALYQELACDLVATDGTPATALQDDSQASYSLWRDERDYHLNFAESAARLRRKVDALGSPLPGARCLASGVEMRVLEAEELADVKIENRDIGKVIFYRDGFPVVVCGSGLLKIKKLTTPDGADVAFPLKSFRTRFE